MAKQKAKTSVTPASPLFAEAIRNRIEVARQAHNDALRAKHARLSKAQERAQRRALAIRMQRFETWLAEHGEDAMAKAADKRACGIVIRGFGAKDKREEEALLKEVVRIVKVFAQPRKLSASEPEMFAQFITLDGRSKITGRMETLLGVGGFRVHICSHTPSWAGNCKNHERTHRIDTYLF